MKFLVSILALAAPEDILALVPRLARLKWPEAVSEAVTDSDGRFALRVKPGDWALVATAARPLLLTKNVELYFWRVPVGPGSQPSIILSDENARSMTGAFVGSEKEKLP